MLQLILLVLQRLRCGFKLLFQVLRDLRGIRPTLLRPTLFITLQVSYLTLVRLNGFQEISIVNTHDLLLAGVPLDLNLTLLILIVQLRLQLVKFLLQIIHLLMKRPRGDIQLALCFLLLVDVHLLLHLELVEEILLLDDRFLQRSLNEVQTLTQ